MHATDLVREGERSGSGQRFAAWGIWLVLASSGDGALIWPWTRTAAVTWLVDLAFSLSASREKQMIAGAAGRWVASAGVLDALPFACAGEARIAGNTPAAINVSIPRAVAITSAVSPGPAAYSPAAINVSRWQAPISRSPYHSRRAGSYGRRRRHGEQNGCDEDKELEKP
jgi:hypothetical protein